MIQLTNGEQATVEVIQDQAEKFTAEHSGGYSLVELAKLRDKSIANKWRRTLFATLKELGLPSAAKYRQVRLDFLMIVFEVRLKSSNELNWTQIKALHQAAEAESVWSDLSDIARRLVKAVPDGLPE